MKLFALFSYSFLSLVINSFVCVAYTPACHGWVFEQLVSQAWYSMKMLSVNVENNISFYLSFIKALAVQKCSKIVRMMIVNHLLIQFTKDEFAIWISS